MLGLVAFYAVKRMRINIKKRNRKNFDAVQKVGPMENLKLTRRCNKNCVRAMCDKISGDNYAAELAMSALRS